MYWIIWLKYALGVSNHAVNQLILGIVNVVCISYLLIIDKSHDNTNHVHTNGNARVNNGFKWLIIVLKYERSIVHVHMLLLIKI